MVGSCNNTTIYMYIVIAPGQQLISGVKCQTTAPLGLKTSSSHILEDMTDEYIRRNSPQNYWHHDMHPSSLLYSEEFQLAAQTIIWSMHTGQPIKCLLTGLTLRMADRSITWQPGSVCLCLDFPECTINRASTLMDKIGMPWYYKETDNLMQLDELDKRSLSHWSTMDLHYNCRIEKRSDSCSSWRKHILCKQRSDFLLGLQSFAAEVCMVSL